MVDLQLLKRVIDESGLKKEKIASEMGITRQTLNNKLNGKFPFNNSDVMLLTQILGLTKKNVFEIFLNNKPTQG